MSTRSGAAPARPGPVLVHSQAAGLDGEYAADHWNAQRLGVPARRGRRPGPVRCHHPGLAARGGRAVVPVPPRHRVRVRDHLRRGAGPIPVLGVPGRAPPGIATRPASPGRSWRTTCRGSARATRLPPGRFAQRAPGVLRRLPPPRLAAGLPHERRHLRRRAPLPPRPGGPLHPRVRDGPARSAAAFDRLPFTTTRNLVVVLIETGLRGGDACGLAFSPTLDDSAGWPCLRFEAAKVRAEQLIRSAPRPRRRSAPSRSMSCGHWPAGSPWLFPGITGNDDGAKPYSHRTFAQQLAHWQRVIGLRDQAGQPVTYRSPVPPHTRNPAHQQRRPPARRAEAARSRQPAHDRALRPRPRHHHPRGVR